MLPSFVRWRRRLRRLSQKLNLLSRHTASHEPLGVRLFADAFKADMSGSGLPLRKIRR